MSAVEQRFIKHIAYEPNCGCWLWMASTQHNGYGKFDMKTDAGWRPRQAHRVAWEIWRGAVPPGTMVCHSCDVRSCVNPDHLFLGTAQDNTDDMMRKGRQRSNPPCGERSPKAKLSAADVAFIRSSSASHASLGRKFGVNRTAIWQVRNKVSWAKGVGR